jgi:hypothetical protein
MLAFLFAPDVTAAPGFVIVPPAINPNPPSAPPSVSLIEIGSGSIDGELEGIRGAPVRWAVGGVEYSGSALIWKAPYLYLDSAVAVPPTLGSSISVGSQRHSWETGWLDMGTPEQDKQLRWVDLVMKAQPSGTVVLEVMTDFDLDPDVVCDVDLSEGRVRFDAGAARGYHFKFRIRSEKPASPVSFEVSRIICRLEEQEVT